MFTVPGFAAISCDLVHVKVQDQVDEDSELESSRTLDAFVRKNKEEEIRPPCTIEVSNSCYVGVSLCTGGVCTI